MMLCALSAWHAGPSQIVIAGKSEFAKRLAVETARHYLPFSLVLPVAPGAAQDRVARRLPFTASMTGGGEAAAYVCRDFTCRQPVGTPEALAAELGMIAAPR
jgi:uncharacterized protein YyaL (SSP411 family)